MTTYVLKSTLVNLKIVGGWPTKGAVNIVDIVGVTGRQTTKGAVNIGDIVGISGSKISRVPVGERKVYVIRTGTREILDPLIPTISPIFTAPLVVFPTLIPTITPIFTAALWAARHFHPLCLVALLPLWPVAHRSQFTRGYEVIACEWPAASHHGAMLDAF